MRVLPIKLPDQLYNNLKLLSQETGSSMAEIIRGYVSEPIGKRSYEIKKAKRSKKSDKEMTLLEIIEKHRYDGPDHCKGLTDDEILYGGKLGDY